MAKLDIQSVQMTRHLDGGPDEVVIVVRTQGGKTLDLIVNVPRGNDEKTGGDAYVRDLGVTEYQRSEPRIETENGRRKLVGADYVTVKI